MKLFWHIGPHKTGTTSLQLALAAQAASGRASYYYPPVDDFGPGHALLAWRLLGLNGRTVSLEAISDEVAKAEQKGFSAVVLSSEEFSRALLGTDSFAPLARICDSVECELILTLRPLSDRLYPELQENVKHGDKVSFATPHDLLTICANRPGLRADFLPAAIIGSHAARTSVILVDPATPQRLFDGMSAILGEAVPPARPDSVNSSYPFLKMAWLEAINRYERVKPEQARAAVEVAFHHATKQLSSLSATPYPPIPPVLKRYLDGVWDLQLAYLAALADTGRVRLV